MRDYDKYTPKERAERRICEHGVRWSRGQSCQKCLLQVQNGEKKLDELPKSEGVVPVIDDESAAHQINDCAEEVSSKIDDTAERKHWAKDLKSCEVYGVCPDCGPGRCLVLINWNTAEIRCKPFGSG